MKIENCVLKSIIIENIVFCFFSFQSRTNITKYHLNNSNDKLHSNVYPTGCELINNGETVDVYVLKLNSLWKIEYFSQF